MPFLCLHTHTLLSLSECVSLSAVNTPASLRSSAGIGTSTLSFITHFVPSLSCSAQHAGLDAMLISVLRSQRLWNYFRPYKYLTNKPPTELSTVIVFPAFSTHLPNVFSNVVNARNCVAQYFSIQIADCKLLTWWWILLSCLPVH